MNTATIDKSTTVDSSARGYPSGGIQNQTAELVLNQPTGFSRFETILGQSLWFGLIPIIRLSLRGHSFEIISPTGRRILFGKSLNCSFAIQVRRYMTLLRIVIRPRMALGEEYVAGNWNVARGSLCDVLSELLKISNEIENSYFGKALFWVKRRLFLLRQRYGIRKSREYVKTHYDQGEHLFHAFLDKNLVYTCADFENGANDIDQAQLDKIRNTLRRLDLRPSHKLMEIGFGWGCASRIAAQEIGASVTGLTLSIQQLEHAEKKKVGIGESADITYELNDYREHEKGNSCIYDRVLSIGMVEHVGYHQLQRYFREVCRLLKPGGITLAHTITRDHPGVTNPWIDKYIFPGGYIASRSEIIAAAESAGLKIHGSPYKYEPENYIKTLKFWDGKLKENWEFLVGLGYSEYTKLIYEFYFAGSEAAFREMRMYAMQFIFQKPECSIDRNEEKRIG